MTKAIPVCLAFTSLAWLPLALLAQSEAVSDAKSQTPIKHVIIIIGENRTFDHVFGTYVPANPKQTVSNLLSKGIVDANGQPGVNAGIGAQYSAVNTSSYTIAPGGKQPYTNIPAPCTQSAHQSASDFSGEPFQTREAALVAEPDLTGKYRGYLLTGATGLPQNSVDTRIANVNSLGSGLFQITSSVPYDAYTGGPTHRFYQMWQQVDCSAAAATAANPSGCLFDLVPWVEVATGQGYNGETQPSPFTNTTTGEGGIGMSFINMQQGDAPYLKRLADHFTLSDNYHQPTMGGTGTNHIMLGYADALWYSDANGKPATPPANQIENPNPQPGTNNWYTQDGYFGGSYSNCSDSLQPGVAPIVNYLQALAKPIAPNCAPGTYYILNNYNPGYNGDGTVNTGVFTVPPTTARHIGDVLSDAGVSYTYFGEGWNLYITDPLQRDPYDQYCTICNPFQYATDIMTSPARREAHIKDTSAFYEGIVLGKLPAVSFVKPSAFLDGHPSSSKLDLFEGFVQRIVDQVQDNATLWADTAIFITFDEGGGYYDSGYIQPVDFFGDGPRVPLLIVSPFSRGGVVNHRYADHVSLTKFIEKNWKLKPISKRSRDNFPNPRVADGDPYVPTNSPALSDLMDAFRFPGVGGK